MTKPAKFSKGKKLPEGEYKHRLEKYYKEKGKTFHEYNAYAKFKNKCLNKRLFSEIRREAKKKFKVYPSSYASAWIKSEYKKRGGKFRKEQKNTVSKSNEPILVEPPERKIVEHRGDAKEGDLWIHPNTGNLKMKVGDKWVTVNNPNEIPKINKQKAKKDLSAAFAERRKKQKVTEKIIKKQDPGKITRGQFLYKYKSPQNFYSWQDLAREHINCPHRNKQYIYNSPAYYLKDDLCNSLINTNTDNLVLSERPNIVNPSFFLLHSNNINDIKYSFIECHKWSLKNSKLDEEPKSHSQIFDVYVNFVVDESKIYYFAFNWKNLKMPKFGDELIGNHVNRPNTKKEVEYYEQQFSTVVNLLLLMNQQPDIITEEYIPSRVIDIQKKIKVQSPIKPSAISWVGKDFTRRVIKIKPKMDEKDFVISGNTRKIKPHWRRGHWHTVLKGKNRKERKMRWYQPVFVMSNAA